jgi:hypothetical protein
MVEPDMIDGSKSKEEAKKRWEGEFAYELDVGVSNILKPKTPLFSVLH